jgi:diguanylate cyclase (GGDEF)-like protein/PAS domain S-box-containing protein
MFRVLYCLQTRHDPLFVVLAALVCLGACLTAVFLYARARQGEGVTRLTWTLISGGALGFGIWATHFIAMMAYSAGVPVRYDLALTLGSLLLAIFMTTLGMSQTLKVSKAPLRQSLIGGTLVGAGISGMHFMGMSALQFPRYIDWAWDLVATSVFVSIAFSALFFYRVRLATSPLSQGLAALCLVLAIAGLHFIAMGAVTVVPNPLRTFGGQGLSAAHMSIIITLTAFVISATTLTAAITGQRRDRDVAASERNFRILLEAVTDYAIYMLDPNGHVSNWNSGAQRIKGYASDEVIGKHISMFYPSDMHDKAQKALDQALEAGRYSEEGLRVRKGGETFWAQVVMTPLFDPATGQHIGFAKVTRDISEQKAAQDSLLQLKNMLNTAISNMSQGLCLFDHNECIQLYNPQVADIFNLSSAQLTSGTTLKNIIRDVMINRLGRTPDPEALEDRYRLHRETLMRPEGGIVDFDFGDRRIAVFYRPLPEGGWVSTIDDVTERLATKNRIDFLANHDKLTGLANRDVFNQRLAKALKRTVEQGEPLAVICLDIDQFATINDHHGHGTGDEVLCEVARRLQAQSYEGGTVARIGGDEFALFGYVSDQAQLERQLEDLAKALNRPMLLGENSLRVSIRLGAALAPVHGTDFETLINNAKLAQARAKDLGAASYCLYQIEMDEASRQRRLLASDLHQALARKEFQVHYQVQKSIVTGAVTGYEALIRWRHPERGMVSPVDFIPVAESTGLIAEIGEWVLRTACIDAMRLPSAVRIAVNLSPIQLNQPDLVRRVHEILLETGLPPARLELEITESSLISDKVRALHSLRQLKALGVSIAMDDFGTGYSSLETLNAFPFDKIKIDRSFLMASHQSRQSLAIMRAIIALGKSLEIPVLCEGVETLEHVVLLAAEGCNEVQGYLYGRPMPLEDVLSIDNEPRMVG